MISINAPATQSTGAPVGQWTDQALMAQMSVLYSLLESSHLDLKYMSNQCLLLSKILDSLVEHNWKPLWRAELLPIIRKLFDSFTTGHDVSGNTPVQLLQSGGSATTDFQGARVYLDSISNRFYPRLQVNSIFVAVYAKVGYEVLMCDFNVPRMHVQDRVYLYVGQQDKTETSTCIVTPAQVNILLNGHQVEKRVTAGYLDAGPQMPSDVTNLVKVGSNVLQAIGEFSVSYVIAVASSRAVERSAKNAELQDYVAPSKAASEVDPTEVDDEVVEGASRVSLRCPISHQRLVVPVKATTCRHLQCFDYDSFLKINENRPAWRCPCCNSFISCPDLRIDRQMEKVLKDTDEKIHEVIFNQDGSWVPVSTDDDETEHGSDVVIIEGVEGGRKYIDLSDMDDEESIRRWQNNHAFQQHERKPDAETLQAMLDNRGNASHTTNPVVRQRDTVGHPVIDVPEFTTVASQSSSPSFSGHVWAGNQVQNQPSPSIQSMSAVNHNFQVRFPQSRSASHVSSPAGSVSRLAANSAHTPFTQLQQQPQSGAPSNIGLVAENGWVRQRQVGQESPGTSQNVQDLGQMRPQWRSTGVPSPQLGTNTQSHYLQASQHLQSQVSPSPRQHSSPGTISRQQHVSPGNLQQQRPSPGINLHHQHASPGTSQQQRPSPGIPVNSHHQHASAGPSHQQHSSPGTSQQQRPNPGIPVNSHHQHASIGNSHQQQLPSPGINSQQTRPGVWGGATVGQWHSTSSVNQAQALGGVAAALEQRWRPAQRMRGSMTNPSLGHIALGTTSPSAVQQQRVPPASTFPSMQTTHALNTATNANSVPVPRFQMGMGPAPNNQAANNVSLYNGTTWVNAPDFSSAPLSAPLFSEGWNFDDLDLSGLPH